MPNPMVESTGLSLRANLSNSSAVEPPDWISRLAEQLDDTIGLIERELNHDLGLGPNGSLAVDGDDFGFASIPIDEFDWD